MNGFNKVILAGNLTRDPELRYTPSGTAISAFGLAINRKFRDGGGETKEEVTFVDVQAFGKTAELAGQYLKKGNPVLIDGRLKLDQWDDKQTQQKRSKLTVVAEAINFLPSGNAPAPREQTEAKSTPPPTRSSTPARQATEPEGMPPEEDDVPF